MKHHGENASIGKGIDPTHKSGPFSTKNKKSKSTSGSSPTSGGKGGQVGNFKNK